MTTNNNNTPDEDDLDYIDFDDDYDDDFSDDEDAEERSYVNIDTPAADDAADKKEKAED